MARVLPFTKAQAVGNDFLVVEWSDVSALGIAEEDLGELARKICDRYLGVGADGLEVVYADEAADARIRVFNSDASEAEISGNGTRCVAAYLMGERALEAPLNIATVAGTKRIELTSRDGDRFELRMSMGAPSYQQEDIACELSLATGTRTCTIVDVGNPQCALFVDDFDLDWRAMGAEIERHERFPNRTNVSFIRVHDRNTVDVRFWERGAGETASSGTGSTGAAAASILSGQVDSPVEVRTVAGPMRLSWDGEMVLEGPAEIVATGEYRLPSL